MAKKAATKVAKKAVKKSVRKSAKGKVADVPTGGDDVRGQLLYSSLLGRRRSVLEK